MPYNSKSLENLTHKGRPLDYGEPKKHHRINLTDTGWSALQSLQKQLEYGSVSEMLEEIARGSVILTKQ
jgi:hypothetical protein